MTLRSNCKSTPQLSIDDITYNSSVLLSGKSSTFTGFVIPRLSQLTLNVLSLFSQLHFGGQVKERLTLDPSKNSVTMMRCLKTAFIMARRQCQKFLSIRIEPKTVDLRTRINGNSQITFAITLQTKYNVIPND